MNMEIASSVQLVSRMHADDGCLPIVIWEGFESVPHPASVKFHSVANPRPEPLAYSNPNVLVIVRRHEAMSVSELVRRLDEGSEGRLFRPASYAIKGGVTSRDIDEIEALVARIVSERYSALARRNADLTRELFEIRRVHEDLQAAFEQVEHYMHVNGLNEPELLLELSPAQTAEGASSLPISVDTPVVLSLPYELNRVAGFSINIRRSRSKLRNHTRLVVKMSSGTADEVYGVWSTPVERLPESGWFSFLLDKLTIDYGHSIRISFQLDGEADVRMALTAKPLLGASLTPSLPSGGVEDSIHALPAVRLWRGLPGTRMVQALDLRPFDFEGHGDARKRVIQIPLIEGTVEQIFATEMSSALLVSTHADDRSVQVHPVPKGIVVAMVRHPLPEQQCRIQAVVGTRHAEGSAVEFAMVVAESPEDAVRILSDEADSAVIGWVLADASREASLEIACEASRSERNLYLATRLPEGGTTKYAWSRFRNIKVIV